MMSDRVATQRASANRINVANRTVLHGDNLTFLRGINTGTVHLIATDPPFNKSKDFHATPDSLAAGARFADRWKWDTDVHPDWEDAIQDDWPAVWQVIEAAKAASGSDMAAYLCWLGVRLMEMHRVLRDDGSIYLHIDHTAHAWTKALMDAIFGRDNFRNEIVWAYTGPANTKRWFPRKHDSILFYAKSVHAVFNRDAVRVPYNEETLARRGRTEGSNSIISPSVETTSRRNKRQVKARFGGGKVPESWWSDIPALTNQTENTRYPTQKPLALYERIIKASSNPGDLVLDPFAGCATTPVAAERLGRQWIGMDIWDGAYEMVLVRLKAEGLTIDGESDRLLTLGDVHYSTAPPIRSDDNAVAAPAFTLKSRRYEEPPGPRMTRAEMKQSLIDDYGMRCNGCDREFDDERYIELDHNTPRSDGGLNHISNRVLLCGPCNRIKSNTRTLTGLRRENAKLGRMRG